MAMSLSLKEKKSDVVNQSIRELQSGRNNAGGTFTLNANATTTTVSAPNCSPTSVVVISPLTFDAANDMATTWIQPGAGSFVVNHANNSRVDRTFGYLAMGGE